MARIGQARRMVLLAALCKAAGKPIPSIWPEGLQPTKSAMAKWVAAQPDEKVDKKPTPKKTVKKDGGKEESE